VERLAEGRPSTERRAAARGVLTAIEDVDRFNVRELISIPRIPEQNATFLARFVKFLTFLK